MRITLASIGDAVISTDVHGRIGYMNRVAEDLTGWTQQAASGVPLQTVFRIIDEHSRVPVENPAEQAIREGRHVTLQPHTLLIAQNGTERPIEDVAAPMYDEDGTPLGAVLVFRDASAQRHADAARTRLATIIESSEDAIISKSLDGIIRTWNAGAERLFGYSADEAVGQSIKLIIPPERFGEEEAILQRLRRGERINHYETVRIAKDGHAIDISLSVSPLRDSNGHIYGASKVARDITARKQVEEQTRRVAAESLRAAEMNAKFRAFFEQGTNYATVLAVEGTVAEANRLWLDAMALTRDAVLGKPFWECPCWNRSEQLMAMIQSACSHAAAGRMFRCETPFFLADGTERFVDLVLAPITDDCGQVLFVATTATDITERRRMEDALRTTDRRKDEFLALLAHELRNPLAPIRTGLQVIKLAGGDPAIIARSQTIMERQLTHLIRIVDDLLDISRITTNRIELRRAPVRLSEVIGLAVETARPAIDAGGHELHLELPGEQVVLDADMTRLAQVFSNLFTNSAKYTPRGGRIVVTAALTPGHVAVQVRDNGVGIPRDSLPSVFEMFSRVTRSVEHAPGGLGLGLALVKVFVEMHGGSVTAESEGEGRGSTFTVTLPAVTTGPRSQDVHPRIVVEPGPRRVLVVDDNWDGAETLAEMLGLLGNVVRIAHDGLEALAVAEQFRPQLILMDVGMPRLNGLDVTRRIREQPWGRTPTIIALTGWGQEIDRIQSREAGCDGHLVKPVSLADLQRTIEELGHSR